VIVLVPRAVSGCLAVLFVMRFKLAVCVIICRRLAMFRFGII
jgi:hypothetical protein